MQDSERHDFGNAYEVELPTELNISPIFNISDLTEYYEGGDGDEVGEEHWSVPATSLVTKEIEEILDNHVEKGTRNKTYEKYLVKWKGKLVKDSSWIEKEKVTNLDFLLNT